MFKRKIELAKTDQIDAYGSEVHQVLLAIAKYMIEPGESADDWVDCCFVSDEASFSIF